MPWRECLYLSEKSGSIESSALFCIANAPGVVLYLNLLEDCRLLFADRSSRLVSRTGSLRGVLAPDLRSSVASLGFSDETLEMLLVAFVYRTEIL